MEEKKFPEQSLDPQEWDAFRMNAHLVLNDMINYLQDIRTRPVWKPTSEKVRNHFNNILPEKGQSFHSIYNEFKENILPYNNGNIHPRFWGWVMGTGSPTGMVADMMASAMNPSPSFGDHADVYVESQVIEWVKQMFQLNPGASGLLTTGGSTANIIALSVARNAHQKSVRSRGMAQLSKPLVVYGSVETHSCVAKAVEIIGVGSDYYRKIPVDDKYQIRIDLLQEQIQKDKSDGLIPFCIIGNAGTVSTGAIDDLEAIASIAEEEKMWFHLDGAFGLVPKILPEYDLVLKGAERADSIAVDFHKWFYVNYDCACFIIKDQQVHKDAFGISANYLMEHERGITSGSINPHLMGFELSRGFRSLKVWMMLKEAGLEKYRTLIRQNLNQARYVEQLINKNNYLELAAPVQLNVVCFRFVQDGLTTEDLNRLNKEIVMKLHETGVAAPSFTMLQGRYVIRLAIVNHRSRKEDFDILVEKVIEYGKQSFNKLSI